MKEAKLPTQFIWAVLLISVLPFLLNLLGIDFGSPRDVNLLTPSTMAPHQLIDGMHHSLSGSFTHTILEWSAFSTAIFTAVLSFVYFQNKRDVVTPIIGVSLFFAGSMDAFHTLAADRLIEGAANTQDLIPFTWAICRLFNALILIVGTGIFLVTGSRKWRGNLGFIGTISLVFGAIAYTIIHACATSSRLPQTTFPDALITRPWDFIPLLLFVFAGLFVFPRFYQRYPSLFSHSLLISVIPSVAVQLHMTFGSTALFDNHFNIGHFLKIIAYLVPFVGLSLEYVQTYRNEAIVLKMLANSSELVSATIEQQEEMALHQVVAVNQTTTTMDELNRASRQSSEQAEAAAKGAHQVLKLVNGAEQEHLSETSFSLRAKVGQIADQILQLSSQAAQISMVSKLVSDLANQTNMLALNAAVEAARAGDDGKGFAVIATEIRQLADQSRKSAEQINGLVLEIQRATKATVSVSDEGCKTVDAIADAVNNITINSQQISLNANQQAIAIQQVVETMRNLNQGATKTADGISETKVELQHINESLLRLANN
jgi:two-component system, NtrC family, sensor kinase